MIEAALSERLLQLLVSVAESDEVRSNPDLLLYGSGVLDSMKTVDLMLALEAEFGIHVSPAEFERQSWATPRKMIADIEDRLEA